MRIANGTKNEPEQACAVVRTKLIQTIHAAHVFVVELYTSQLLYLGNFSVLSLPFLYYWWIKG